MNTRRFITRAWARSHCARSFCARSHCARSFWAAALLGAATAVPSTATAQVQAAQTVSEPSVQSRQLFRQGAEALGEGTEASDREALSLFQQAYEHSPYWKILGNLGIAAFRTERYGEAIAAFEAYLKQGRDELDPQEVEQVERDLNFLHFDAATVVLDLETAQAPLWVVDSRRQQGTPILVNRYGPLESGRTTLTLHSGFHQLQLESAEGEYLPWDVNLQPGSNSVHRFAPVPAPSLEEDEVFQAPPSQLIPPPVHPTAWTQGLWGASAVLATAAGGMFWKSRDVQSKSDAEYGLNCPEGSGTVGCPVSTPGDRNAAAWSTASFVALGASALALGVGTYLYFDSPRVEPEQVAVRVRVTPGGLGLSGRF